MTNYRETLNLPQTEFAMRANLPKREPETLKTWEAMRLYQRITEHCAGRKQFILHDGPPYANGTIHIGHAVNKVLKDIILKSKRLEGFDCPYVPGWDCHGLPIELEVEKKHGKPGDKLTLEDFYAHCRTYAQRQIESQRDDFIRLGVLGDWAQPYLTMSHSVEADTVRALALMLREGYIGRGSKPVHWCMDCRSALAEAEVEYQQREATAVDVLFRACDPAHAVFATTEVGKDDVVGIPIWTTTAWTLPANQAVAVNVDFIYQLFRCRIGDTYYRLLVAKELYEEVVARYQAQELELGGEYRGSELEGVLVHHPFYERVVPIVSGHHVSADSGTGAVHIAPAHGVDDYQIGKHCDLPVHSEVDERGCYASSVSHLAGIHIHKAIEPILELLITRGHLLARAQIEHAYPCCWRHKSGIIFRTTKQWFVRMQHRDLLKECCAQIEDVVRFEPPRARMRMQAMLADRPDWCISRQRSWGIPIAVFMHKQTGELHPDTDKLLMRVADEVAKHGIEYWRASDETELLGKDAHDYEKCTDIMDVWFDSGVTHRVVLDENPLLRRPADMYLEGSDQHRGWFQSSLLTSVAMNSDAPYKQLLSHGFVVDEDGYKMSKSRGNVVSPQQVVQKMGADILRLWVASTDYRDEMKISEAGLERTVDVYRRLRNTMRFMLANLRGFDVVTHRVAQSDMLSLDRWIVHRAALLEQVLRPAYERYQFHTVGQKVHHFCAMDLGAFYLDIIKDRQYTMHSDGLPRRSAQTALFLLVDTMVRWIAPILSFTAEEVWSQLHSSPEESIKPEDSVFLASYTDELAPFVEEDTVFSDSDWDSLMEVRNAANGLVERFRAENKLGSSLEAELTLYCDERLLDLLARLGAELRFLMLSSSADIVPMKQAKDAVETDVRGLKLGLRVSTHQKCQRCWHRRPEVGQLKEADLCARCVQNISGEVTQSEQRRFV